MAGQVINLTADLSGFFTVSGTTAYPEESLKSGWTKAGEVSGKEMKLYSNAEQLGVYDSVGGYSITLGGAAHAASVSIGTYLYGTAGNDSVSIAGTGVHLYLGSGNDTITSAATGANEADVKTGAGKDSIIIGGNSGIGLEAARGFAAEGAKVVITGRNAGRFCHPHRGRGERGMHHQPFPLRPGCHHHCRHQWDRRQDSGRLW